VKEFPGPEGAERLSSRILPDEIPVEADGESAALKAHVVSGCLVLPVQAELNDRELERLQRDLLENIRKTGLKKAVILLSGVHIMDSFIVRTLSDTARMASLMGTTTVLAGVTAGAAASIVDLGLDFEGIPTARTLEHGIRLLDSGRAVAPA